MPNQGLELFIIAAKGGDQVAAICFPLKLARTLCMNAVQNAGKMSDSYEDG